MNENEIAKRVVDAAYSIHRSLGPGLLESSYEECLFYEIINAGLLAEKQKPLPLIYKDVRMDIGYRIDIIIENKFIVEVKSVDAFNDVHLAQILTYMRLSDCKLGLIINFNVSLIKYGIKRVVNGLVENR